jgi:hypothetical protein
LGRHNYQQLTPLPTEKNKFFSSFIWIVSVKLVKPQNDFQLFTVQYCVHSIPVFSAGARDKFGGKNPAAFFFPALHDTAEFAPANRKI